VGAAHDKNLGVYPMERIGMEHKEGKRVFVTLVSRQTNLESKKVEESKGAYYL